MNKTGIFFAVVVAAMSATAIMLSLRSPSPVSVAAMDTPATGEQPILERRTIGSEWNSSPTRHPPTKQQTPDENATSLAIQDFDIPYIARYLSEVRLDDDGNVVIDHLTLDALNETLAHRYPELTLDPAQVEALQELVRVGLSGAAGEQAAQLVGNYYQLLKAQQELDNLYQRQGDARNHEAEYREQVSLREMYLGADVARQLFAMEDRDARYMMASMELAQRSTLSAEERNRQQAQLRRRYVEDVPAIPDWPARHAAYQQEKRNIQAAGLPEQEMQSQLHQLLAQHFKPGEIEIVRTLEAQAAMGDPVL